jgi:hypothetical protein
VPSDVVKERLGGAMLINFSIVTWMCLMIASFLLGSVSPFFSGSRTIWKALGLWGLGLGAGNAAFFVSLYILTLQGQERAALRAAGKQVPLNDMPGFGQALIASFGSVYFAALIVTIGVVFATKVTRHRLMREIL